MNMIDLHLIETFIIYSDNLNLVKTAKLTNQSQPSASRQIEKFQRHFKKKLFISVGKTRKLTPYGEEIKKYYQPSMRQLLQLREKFHEYSFADQKEKLTVAARSEILQKYISPIRFNGLVELLPLSGSEIRYKLEQSQLDIAVLQENFDTFNYFRKKLFTSTWTIAAPKTWGISSISTLTEKPFAAYESNLNYLSKSKLAPPLIQFIANDWRLLADKVAQQECWAILPSEFCEHPKISRFSADSLMKDTSFFIYFRKDLSKNKDVQYIIDQLS